MGYQGKPENVESKNNDNPDDGALECVIHLLILHARETLYKSLHKIWPFLPQLIPYLNHYL